MRLVSGWMAGRHARFHGLDERPGRRRNALAACVRLIDDERDRLRPSRAPARDIPLGPEPLGHDWLSLLLGAVVKLGKMPVTVVPATQPLLTRRLPARDVPELAVNRPQCRSVTARVFVDLC